MSPTLLMALALMSRPELVADRYALPEEAFCQAMHETCGREVCCINEQLWHVNGWHRQKLQAHLDDVERVRLVWWWAWWLRWPRATRDQLEEAECHLFALIGHEAYWRGELPLPLSLR